MREHLILLPGWGLGSLPLEGLAEALRGLDPMLRVDIAPLPELASGDVRGWLLELDARLPPQAWLGGWSLGGLLAGELAALRGERCRGLLTLASNPRFVAGAGWPHGMDEASFDAFVDGCRADPAATLKRFSLLCSQGSAEARGLARQLQAALPCTAPQVLLAGLAVLGNCDGRGALQAFAGPQLHLLGGADALVPAEVAGELLALQPGIEVGLIEDASHAFPLERPREVVAAILAFIGEAGNA
ncbi:alpha/beta fold hydrolase [Thauera linaloolentis]|uniref:Alpha/beta hydrolase n=1 Tax=Thauera linaloolentis (strain DSM 12138 / JCM 21573 / CCUG 41526 / CIP 105981 / IAM 15112 / NBRC 102519 / 47Lol) TaxID=1123367 RepID=N6Z9V6_THAL4|nr:alpha/beta fold hydrolase [Thauera linaloolentis]ENO88924.1 alpha/beta hydrolase [Thauera linaloolentis 47Lol = DSM 12138]MCM8564781.1 alpha/beta fold hydrolase [Thauera linaloolentis]